jgi:hypothetical protein
MKKFLTFLLILSLSASPASASFFSDFCGAIFTILTCPIALVAPDNPTLRKNNPFRKKLWEEEQKEEERFLRLARNKFSLRPMQEIAENMEILDENFDTLKNNFLYFRESVEEAFEKISKFMNNQDTKNEISLEFFERFLKRMDNAESNINTLFEVLTKHFKEKETRKNLRTHAPWFFNK